MNQIRIILGTCAALALLAACGGQTRSETAASAPAPAAATADGAALSPKAAVEERKRLMESFKKDFGAMGKMVKGETPYDAAAFLAAAERLAENSDKPWAHYTAESANEESDAKPDVWSNPEGFKKAVGQFTAAAAALKTAAASGGLDAVKKPFGEVGQSCKSCHGTFRAD